MFVQVAFWLRRSLRYLAAFAFAAAGALFLWAPDASADNCSTFSDCFGQSGAASEAVFGLTLLAALSLLVSFLPVSDSRSGESLANGQQIEPWEQAVGMLGPFPIGELANLGGDRIVTATGDRLLPEDAASPRNPDTQDGGFLGGPLDAVAEQLRESLGEVGDVTDDVHERFPDPVEAQAVLDLLAEGIDLEIAAASVSGDWSDVPGGDPSLYSQDQRDAVVQLLDLDPADELAARGADQLFDLLPDTVIAKVFNQGMTLDLQVDVPGFGESGRLLSAGTQLRAAVELSGAQIGPGFSQTHEVKITGELVRRAGGPLTGTDLGYLRDALEKLDSVPQELKDWFETSPTVGKLTHLPVGVTVEAFEGEQLQYSATIGDDQARRLGGGDLDVLPDIYNPASFEPGNSALIRSGDVQGSNFEFRYKKLVLGGSNSQFEGLGFGITKIDDTTIAVYSGPIDAVESQTRVGVPGVSLTGTKVAQLVDFVHAEIDISTPEGRLAYDNFIAGHGVPVVDGPGVVTSTQSTVSLEADLGVDVGPVEWAISDTEASRTIITYADGTEAMKGEAMGDNSYFSYTFDPVTNEVESATVVVTDIRHNAAQSLRVHGLNEPPLGPQNQAIQMVFTNADLEAIQEMAKVAQDAAISPAPPGPTMSLRDEIVAAESPAKIAEILQHRSFADPENTLYELEQISRDVSTATLSAPTLPGQFEFRPTT